MLEDPPRFVAKRLFNRSKTHRGGCAYLKPMFGDPKTDCLSWSPNQCVSNALIAINKHTILNRGLKRWRWNFATE
jgi:hypothetical protein